jgi:HPt (histidine-containing phosphotransfer) domain-containing protein
MLDPDTVEMLCAMAASSQAGMLEELIGILESQSAELMDEITGALTKNDAKTVQRAAHTLKGSALNLGAKLFAEACYAVEIAAEEKRLDEIPAKLAAARTVFERTLPVLRATYRHTSTQ